MTEPISVTVSSGVAISAKSTSRSPGDHVAVFNLAAGRRQPDSNHRSRCCEGLSLSPKGDARPINWMGLLSTGRLAR